MAWFSPDLEPLFAVAAGTLDDAGNLLEANAGFLRLIQTTQAQPLGSPVARFFLQPDFGVLARAPAQADLTVYQGLLTLGEYEGRSQTLRARVWRDGPRLRVLAEFDIGELEQLTDTVLELNREYADAQLELARTNIKIAQLNTDLERQVADRTRALEAALLGAEVASRAKSAFLANMNHELRTPMNAILGFAHAVRRRISDPDLQMQLDRITAAGRHLMRIINDILDTARLQADSFDLDCADFDLQTLLDGVLAGLREPAYAKGLTLTLEVDPSLPPVLRGDRHRLAQIVASLVGNAIKFSGRGRIAVRAYRTPVVDAPPVLRLEVQDEGIGIDPTQQVLIFDAFEQMQNTTTRETGGAGLGLAISKQLARRMGGEIGVHSRPGQGSTFWVTVPLVSGTTGALPVAVGPDRAERLAPPGDAPAPVDREQMLQQCAELVRLLADNDVEAQTRWRGARAVFDALLGPRASSFVAAMEQFEFALALEQLKAALANPPAAGAGPSRVSVTAAGGQTQRPDDLR